jgi:monoamine oxidase
MSRSALFHYLRSLAHAGESIRPAQEHAPGFPSKLSRRAFLSSTAAGILLPTCTACARKIAPPRAAAPRIAIVGAGAAGLSCAVELERHGIVPQLYEASVRPGGRVYSSRAVSAAGQIAEFGAEFISANHQRVRELCRRFGLSLDDLQADGPQEAVFFFNGRRLSPSELQAELRPFLLRVSQDAARASRDTAFLQQLDATSIQQYLDQSTECSNTLRALISSACVAEFGLETAEQSACNLLKLNKRDPLAAGAVFEDSERRFRIQGGNESLIKKILESLRAELHCGYVLKAVRPYGSGYRCSFDVGLSSREVFADVLVLAIPCSLLRGVQLEMALPEAQRRAIKELGYATHAKLMGDFRERVWRSAWFSNGTIYSDNGLQAAWDSSRAQTGASAIYSNLAGGLRGLEMNQKSAEAQLQFMLPLLEQVFPGISAHYRQDSAQRVHWASQRWAQGSISCARPGQANWAKLLSLPSGNFYLSGEHCSSLNQGTIEGAVESGQKVASVLLGKIRS